MNRETQAAPAPTPPAWHTSNPSEVFSQLDTSRSGLSEEEAERRLERHGANRLPAPRRRSTLMRFLLQFHNVLIYVLLGAAAVTLALDHLLDSGVILAVVVINALIGFIQEGKAEKALDAIRQMLSPQAAVRRAGRLRTVPATNLVPGDVVGLAPGDRVPADVRLYDIRDLRIDESALTGESIPVDKSTAPAGADAAIGDRTGMAYSGTLVTGGQGFGVVVATGADTEIGRISRLLSEVETLNTPLLSQVAHFARWLTAAILVVATATFLFGVNLRGYSTDDMFLAAVGLAVAAIPEGLPAIMTITLAIGVQRMARRNAIIRRLPAVETLGAVTVICSDKTGTLTRNEMTVQTAVTAERSFQVTGSGYDPHGEVLFDDQSVVPSSEPTLLELIRAGALCNDAGLHEARQGGGWEISGDPMEAALLTLALKAGLDLRAQHETWPRTDVLPFDAGRRYMATLHHDHAGHGFVYVKGAPEQLLEMCTHQRREGQDVSLDRRRWEAIMEQIAQHGQRLLAVASGPAPAGRRDLRFNDVESGLTLLGLVGIMDPPRPEAIDAVERCHDAGIEVKMITGDHGVTAQAIGRQMGIGDARAVMTGRELEQLDDEQMREAVLGTDIFARTSPEQKLRLVTALQANGAVAAMTGDGVNDAPALRRADVGIAMGDKGTEVAKEAAEMVLADDNFASIAYAVEEGRTVYDNLKKAILFIMPTSGGEAFTLVAAIIMGQQLPITPVQILWINMITAVTLGLVLAFEPPEPGVMRRPPRDPATPLLSGMLIWRVLFVSLILVAGVFGLFLWERGQGASLEYARTVAVNTLVAFEMFYLFNARYILAPVLNRIGMLGNRYAWYAIAILAVFQGLFTYSPPGQLLFGTTGLEPASWLRIVMVAASVLFLVESEKWVLRRLRVRIY